MAALLPIIRDLAPLVLPSKIHIKRATDLQPQPSPSTGKISTIPAVTDVSKKLCASVLTLPPQTSTTIRHHGESDTILNIIYNNCTLLSCPHTDGAIHRKVLGPGDFVLIPAWMEYQLLNESLAVGGREVSLDGGRALHENTNRSSGKKHFERDEGLQDEVGIILCDNEPLTEVVGERNVWATEPDLSVLHPDLKLSMDVRSVSTQPNLNVGSECILTLTSSQGSVDGVVELKGWGRGEKR